LPQTTNLNSTAMLYLNLERVLNQKGITNHSIFLQQIGIKGYVVRRMLKVNPTRIDIDLLWILCKELNCTPNDLFSVKASAAPNLQAKHALKNLVREKQAAPISRKLVNLPLDKLAQVQELVDKLVGEEK